MNPALSVIFFTTLFSAGLALAVLTAIFLVAAGQKYPSAVFQIAWLVSLVLIGYGLLASLFHLGHPKRAWRALSQWRSSWLSREAWSAIFVCVLIFFSALTLPWLNLLWRYLLAGAIALFSVLALWCTSRIYSSLKPIKCWQSVYTAPVFFIIGTWSAIPVLFLLLPNDAIELNPLSATTLTALGLSVAIIKILHWRDYDQRNFDTGQHDATGMGALGQVRSFEAPHTQANYLTQEMGFVLARKHAEKLRLLALTGLSFIPIVMYLALGFTSIPIKLILILIVFCIFAGAFVERWLFFAEARHVVMNYYR